MKRNIATIFWEWTRDQCPAAIRHATMPCGMRQSSAIPFLIKLLINMDCLGERDLFLSFPTTGYDQESPQSCVRRLCSGPQCDERCHGDGLADPTAKEEVTIKRSAEEYAKISCGFTTNVAATGDAVTILGFLRSLAVPFLKKLWNDMHFSASGMHLRLSLLFATLGDNRQPAVKLSGFSR